MHTSMFQDGGRFDRPRLHGSRSPTVYQAESVASMEFRVTARDCGSLGFGEGYACAGPSVLAADQVIKVRGERAKYFGPGDRNRNVMNVSMRARNLRPARDVTAMGRARDVVDGYVADTTRNFVKWAAGVPGGAKADWVWSHLRRDRIWRRRHHEHEFCRRHRQC
jgi:hypothetical protein